MDSWLASVAAEVWVDPGWKPATMVRPRCHSVIVVSRSMPRVTGEASVAVVRVSNSVAAVVNSESYSVVFGCVVGCCVVDRYSDSVVDCVSSDFTEAVFESASVVDDVCSNSGMVGVRSNAVGIQLDAAVVGCELESSVVGKDSDSVDGDERSWPVSVDVRTGSVVVGREFGSAVVGEGSGFIVVGVGSDSSAVGCGLGPRVVSKDSDSVDAVVVSNSILVGVGLDSAVVGCGFGFEVVGTESDSEVVDSRSVVVDWNSNSVAVGEDVGYTNAVEMPDSVVVVNCSCPATRSRTKFSYVRATSPWIAMVSFSSCNA